MPTIRIPLWWKAVQFPGSVKNPSQFPGCFLIPWNDACFRVLAGLRVTIGNFLLMEFGKERLDFISTK